MVAMSGVFAPAKTKGKPKHEFRDNVLTITTPTSTMQLQWLPEPIAKEKLSHTRKWQECWPEIRIVSPGWSTAATSDLNEFARQKQEAFAAFTETIPEALREIVEPFHSHQWNLLKLIHGNAYGRELADSNRILAYALANNDAFRKVNQKVVTTLAAAHSHQKQKDICTWLGLPGTASFVRLLKKVSPSAAMPFFMRRLGTSLREDKHLSVRMNHLRTINAGVIELVINRRLRPLLSPALLAEVSELDTELDYGHAAAEMDHALAMLKQMKSERVLRTIRSVRAAEAFAAEVNEEYLAYQRRIDAERVARQAAIAEQQIRQARPYPAQVRTTTGPRKHEWPAPPFPGTDFLEPIASYNMLLAEAAEQDNCVASYWPDIVAGRIYIYKLLSPQRATFSIVRKGHDDWVLSQIKGKSNTSVSPSARQVVSKWMYLNSLGVGEQQWVIAGG